jgi:Mor family transcriptional regulator
VVNETYKVDQIDDLPEVYQQIAEELGLDAALALGRMFGGSPVYFPILKRALIASRNRAIFEEFNGANHRELARKHRLSLRHLYKILKDEQKRSIAARGRPMQAG